MVSPAAIMVSQANTATLDNLHLINPNLGMDGGDENEQKHL